MVMPSFKPCPLKTPNSLEANTPANIVPKIPPTPCTAEEEQQGLDITSHEEVGYNL
jgi:hypothetical protein